MINLTQKQKLFLDEYHKTRNEQRAFQAAGYALTPAQARDYANQILATADAKEYLAMKSDDIIITQKISVESVLRDLEKVKEARKPNDDLKAKVEKHDRLLDKDNKRLEEIESSNQMILKSLLVIINHEITGNGVEKMKAVRDSLEEYLIKR